ncbi:uncharacterized protein LOC135710916 [Ochlerotatus camptorhynchus]|uniref:uncharacterized protein LOC135710916 n=1 Tax=Ochlerotatus camptorhynchus TaxID=644619 RepID=UPI0031D2B3C8
MPPSKFRCIVEDFPALGQQRFSGKFLVIERVDEGETLEKVSPIIIEKTIQTWCGGDNVEQIRRTKEGKCLIKTKNDRQAQALLKLKTISSDINVKIYEHRTLNSCRKVITNRDPYVVTEEEILEVLKNQNVTKVEQIKTKRNGVVSATNSFIITFNSVNAPKYVKCFQFGHIGKACKGEKRCYNYSKSFHGDSCDNTPQCINCADKEQQQQQHRPTSKSCPVWKRKSTIMMIKVDQNLTYIEAKQKVEKSEKKLLL